MNKTDFMNKLQSSLSDYGVADTREILLDFEQHFEDGRAAGETEDMVCEKLGDPVEIAKQYIPDGDISVEEVKAAPKAEEPSAFDSNNYTGAGYAQTNTSQTNTAQQTGYTQTDSNGMYTYNTPPYSQPQQQYQPQGFEHSGGAIVGVLATDLLVFSWALPALVGLIFALYGITIGIGGAGVVTFIAGILMSFMDTSTWLFTTLSPISTSLLGVVMIAAIPLLVIGSIAATKGTINIFKHIINWHSMTFAGKKICTFKKKNNDGEAL